LGNQGDSSVSSKPPRKEIAQIVVAVVRKTFGNSKITEATRFWSDLQVDPKGRRVLFVPIRREIKKKWRLKGVKAADMEKAIAVVDVTATFYAAIQEVGK
jgi:hypothetical protein